MEVVAASSSLAVGRPRNLLTSLTITSCSLHTERGHNYTQDHTAHMDTHTHMVRLHTDTFISSISSEDHKRV